MPKKELWSAQEKLVVSLKLGLQDELAKKKAPEQQFLKPIILRKAFYFFG